MKEVRSDSAASGQDHSDESKQQEAKVVADLRAPHAGEARDPAHPVQLTNERAAQRTQRSREESWRIQTGASPAALTDDAVAALDRLERQGWLRHIEMQADSVRGSHVEADVRETVAMARAVLASQPSEARDAGQDCQQDPFAAVMDLPCIVPVEYEDAAVKMAYRVGHRDARHAAIELLAALSTNSAAARDRELMRLREIASEYDACIRHMDAGGDFYAYKADRITLVAQREGGV